MRTEESSAQHGQCRFWADYVFTKCPFSRMLHLSTPAGQHRKNLAAPGCPASGDFFMGIEGRGY
jgi:hypothetical protein